MVAAGANWAKLALGSVQWGQAYGIANRTGQPSLEEVRGIVELATQAGIRTIDTARAYGASEEVIGKVLGSNPSWRVVTKLAAEPSGDLRQWTRASLDASRACLGRSRLDAVLLHRAEHRTLAGGLIWDELLRQQGSGGIGELGVSVRAPEEAWDLVEAADVSCVQLPCSLLDQRALRTGLLTALQRAGKTVFVRSLFLQGVAHLDVERLPARLKSLAVHLQGPLTAIRHWASERSLAPAEAFLCFGHCLEGTHVLLGCEMSGQLQANLAGWAKTRTFAADLQTWSTGLPELPAEVVNPALWPTLV